MHHVTVYVATDGGDYKIWKSQTTDTQGIFTGAAGHTYQFLALATDNAGNKEQPPVTVIAPSDGFTVNLGELPAVNSTPTDIPQAPTPAAGTPNALFVEAQKGVAAPSPLTNPSEFAATVNPFSTQAFATNIGTERCRYWSAGDGRQS